MKPMHNTTHNTSNIISLGIDTIANWGAGIIIGLVGAITWLVKVIANLLFNNWKKGRDQMEERIGVMEKKMINFEDVVYFEDPTSHEDTNIRRYVVHGFNNQKDASDRILSYLEKHFEETNNK